MDFSGTVFVEWKIINLNLLYWLNKIEGSKQIIKDIYNCLQNNNKLYINLAVLLGLS